MSRQNRLKISFVLNILIFILEVIGGYLAWIRSGWTFIEFYTEDSNTIAMFTSLFLAVYEYGMIKHGTETLPGWLKGLKYFAAVSLTLTFLVVVCLLIPMQGGFSAASFLLLDGSMLYRHLLCPALTFISFLWFDPLGILTKKDVLLSLLPTLIYALILMALNLMRVVEGPYPFLRVYEQPVYMSIIWVIVILGSAYGIAFLLASLLNRLTNR